MEAYEFIEGHENVLSQFGQWPSFHDGEVHRVVLDRMHRNASGSYSPSVEIQLRGWIMTKDTTEGGLYKRQHDLIVHFRFENVEDFALDGFNHQNVLSSLTFTLSTDPDTDAKALHVELEHCYGLSGAFKARKAKILSVVPFVRGEDG